MAVASNGSFSAKESFRAEDISFELKDVNKNKLVLLVYQHTNLWKVDSQEFSQKALIEQSWRQIAAELGVNVECWEQVKRKWKTIKDEYVKWHRYCSNPPPDGAKSRKRSYKPLFHSMEFLDPYLRHRNIGAHSKSSGPKLPKQSPLNGHNAHGTDKTANQTDATMSSADVTTGLRTRRSANKALEASNATKASFDNERGNTLIIKGEPPSKKIAKEGSEGGLLNQKAQPLSTGKKNSADGVRHFLDDISVTLQRLPENKLQYAKMKIQLFLYNLQYGTADCAEEQGTLE